MRREPSPPCRPGARWDAPAAHAATYEQQALPQRATAQRLLTLLPPVAPARILEPGCGTGLYTGLLLAAFPSATLLGLDLSPAALAIARDKFAPRAAFLHADAEEFHHGRYELITANAAFQWFTDLPTVLARLTGLLTPGGTLAFSYFGPETYRELDAALRAVFGPSAHVTCRDFAGHAALAASLQTLFPRWTLEETTIQQTFPSLTALLRDIRHTGTRGTASSPLPWTPHRFAQVEDAYHTESGVIRVSYQVYFCTGVR
jgi:malonyl-CoA O-methyltransferase